MKRETVRLLFQSGEDKISIEFSEWNGRPSVTIWKGSTGLGYSYLLDAINELPKNAKFTGIKINSSIEMLVEKETKLTTN